MPDARAVKPFGEEVRRLIAEREISLRGLAAQAGVDPGFLVRVLQGKQPPSQKLLSSISVALSLAPDYFIEARGQRLAKRLSRSPALVAEFYNRIDPRKTSSGKADPGEDPWLDSPLAILSRADVGSPGFIRLAAAVLVRYRLDDEFRQAVDAALPEMEELAQELNAAD